MFIWDKKDKSFIESCLDPATREKTIRKEKRDRWVGFASVLTGLVLLLVYGQQSSNFLWATILCLIIGFHAHAMSTANLRLARLAEAISRGSASR